MTAMRTIFFGTPLFAAKVLEFLLERDVEVVAAVSKPDRPLGRSKAPVATPVKEVAERLKIPLYQPEKISAPGAADPLKEYDADLFVVVAYGEIIKQHLLDMPKRACINLHASLLPKYRGAAPIQRAIINGEKETGVSIIHMVKAMDAGDIAKRVALPIDIDETYGELQERLLEAGSRALLEVIEEIASSTDKRMAQEEESATFAPKIELEDCEIDWTKPAIEIHNLVRGVNPYPGAWCFATHGGVVKRLKIHRTELVRGEQLPAKSLLHKRRSGLLAGCGDGALLIKELQLEGKKKMTSEELLRGIALDDLTL